MDNVLLEVKEGVTLKAWQALDDFFENGNNLAEAKIAVLVLGVLTKEKQNENNSALLEITKIKLLENGK